jgi:chorismate mutase
MAVRGVRGATTCEHNTEEEILFATRELMEKICTANPRLKLEDVASVFFSVTEDLNAAFPAKGARQTGWEDVPLLDMREIPVPGSLPNCIRVLIHWNTDQAQDDIVHVYLHDAVKLRPDMIARRG